MEKDIDRIPKNPDTDIIIRIDDFGGKRGVTIREFIKGERYTGFTKAGTRIPAEKFALFKAAINSINEKELLEETLSVVPEAQSKGKRAKISEQKEVSPSSKQKHAVSDEESAI